MHFPPELIPALQNVWMCDALVFIRLFFCTVCALVWFFMNHKFTSKNNARLLNVIILDSAESVRVVPNCTYGGKSRRDSEFIVS